MNRDLPSGSTRPEIESYLDAKGWSHSYSTGADTLSYYGGEVGLTAKQLGGVVFAEVANPNVGWLTQGSITVLFFFDPDWRLVRSYVRV
ncbi:MAG: hypothetical protein ACRC33_09180 [Gemmataceae bacterium]